MKVRRKEPIRKLLNLILMFFFMGLAFYFFWGDIPLDPVKYGTEGHNLLGALSAAMVLITARK